MPGSVAAEVAITISFALVTFNASNVYSIVGSRIKSFCCDRLDTPGHLRHSILEFDLVTKTGLVLLVVM